MNREWQPQRRSRCQVARTSPGFLLSGSKREHKADLRLVKDTSGSALA